MEENDQSPPRPFMNFGPGMRAVFLLGICVFLFKVFEELSKTAQLAWLNPSPDNGFPLGYAWLAVSIISVCVFAIPALVYANIFPPDKFAFFRLNKKVSFLTLLFAGLSMIVLILGVEEGAAWISKSISNQELKDFLAESGKVDVWFSQMSTFKDFIFFLIANAVIPAICEELFFRAGIQQILMERIRNFHIPIIVTALVFTIFHADLVSLPLIFLAGLMLGYAFYWTGSLRMTIVMHFLFNGVSIIESYVAQHNSSFAKWEPGIPVVIGSFVLSGAFFFLAWKFSRRVIGN